MLVRATLCRDLVPLVNVNDAPIVFLLGRPLLKCRLMIRLVARAIIECLLSTREFKLIMVHFASTAIRVG